MKKLAAILSLSALATGAFAQGLIGFANTSGTLFSTNGVALGQGSGTAATAAGGFYYTLFTAPSTTTTAVAGDLLTAGWTWTGNYATNTAATTGGRMNGGNNVPTVSNTAWPAGQTNSYVVAAWSANLGHDWSTIAAQLTGATLAGGEWTGPNWAPGSQGGFFGITSVGFGEAGGVTANGTLPYFPLFGSGPTLAGTPITSPTSLFIVTVPEPTTMALCGLGAAAMLIFRRRK